MVSLGLDMVPFVLKITARLCTLQERDLDI